MRDYSRIFWPYRPGSRYGRVSFEEGQIVFNRAVMFAGLAAVVFRGVTYDTSRFGSVGVWLVVAAAFGLTVAWGRWYYRATGADRPGRVLLVDDDPATLDLMERLVRSRGWDVDRAESVAEAVALLAREPSAVLIDEVLPDGSGCDLLAALPRGPSAPKAIVITGAADDPAAMGRITRARPALVAHKPVRDWGAILDAMGSP